MALTYHDEPGHVVRLDISGMLRKSELDAAQDRLLAGASRAAGAAVRLLVVLDGFEGWEPDTRWNDLGFYAEHGDALGRIAIVGAERWRDLALMFAVADLRKAPVEYFLPGALEDARAWLAR